MCTIHDGNHFFRPMSKNDIDSIAAAYPTINARIVHDLFTAMTDHNTARPTVMIVILEGILRLEAGLFGNSSIGATFAYSALQIRDGGNGEIFHRFQDPIMSHIHDAMVQFALAERNVLLVQGVLIEYGYNLTHFHDCGCGLTRDGDGYIDSAEYKAVNSVRSYAESIGAPVHLAATIDNLPLHLTDMHQHEIEGFKRMWKILHSLPTQSFDGSHELSQAFTYLNNMKGQQHAPSGHSQRGYPVGEPLQIASYAT